MRPIFFLLLVLGIGACSGGPSIKNEADAVKLPARVVKVVLPSNNISDGNVTYMPVNGVMVAVPSNVATAPSLPGDGYKYTLAVAGRGEFEVASTHEFFLGQCVLLYVKGAAAGKSHLLPGEALIEDAEKTPQVCTDGGLPGGHK